MSDPLAITEDEALGLAQLAQAQLKLALRLSERALDEPDADEACRLARASERVARGYRQSLLLKSRLGRERDAVVRERKLDAARRETRCEELRERLYDSLRLFTEPAEREDAFEALEREIAIEAARADFLEIDLDDLGAGICARLPLDGPPAKDASARTAGLWTDPVLAGRPRESG